MNIISFAAFLFFFINSVNTLNILAIYPYQGKSHFIVFRVLLKELTNRGHDVTVISHFPEKDPPKNYHDISLAGTTDAIEGQFTINSHRYLGILGLGVYLAQTGTQNCEVMIENQQVQDLIKRKPKFDVILLEQFNSDCALGIAYKLGGPVVATTSAVFMPFHYNRFGIPNNPSYTSFHFLEGGTKPNLYQRIERVIFNLYFKTLYYWFSQRTNQNTLAKYFDDIPPLEDLAREIKLVLAYQNFALTGSNLLPANIIEVGGYHVSKAQPLTGDIKKFVEEAKHGVVYISFGSIVRTTSLPPEKVEDIIGAMNEFPQRFIWKWENKTLNFDKNKLYIDSWLPQVDILGHEKTLAFFSHAGMGGTAEAIYFGVPMIAMPIVGDQPSNAAAIEESGLGIQLHYRHLTKDNLVAALKKVLEPGFNAKAKEVSSAWHDRPRSALDTAVFWTEFAARHPNLSFRTAAADVPFYQYYCLDLIAIFLAIFATFGAITSYCFKIKSKKSVLSVESKRSQKMKKPKRQ